jgi:uncharacterized repeat protein (TIGR04138 family)
MPPSSQAQQYALLQRVVDRVGIYPLEAYEFVHRGLAYTVKNIHGSGGGSPEQNRHVSGQQLCLGLRDYALIQWGMLAEPVLQKWNITSSLDFGKIVFILVENKILSTTEQDHVEDFRDVFDFKTAFQSNYRIACKV